MVHCVTGHQPLSMTGKAQKGRDYYACSYGSSYGDAAALETHAGQKWIYLNEAALSLSSSGSSRGGSSVPCVSIVSPSS
jgi:hypothetical protein